MIKSMSYLKFAIKKVQVSGLKKVNLENSSEFYEKVDMMNK